MGIFGPQLNDGTISEAKLDSSVQTKLNTGGAGTLQDTLVEGQTTGGRNIVVSDGDQVVFGTSPDVGLTREAAGVVKVTDGGTGRGDLEAYEVSATNGSRTVTLSPAVPGVSSAGLYSPLEGYTVYIRTAAAPNYGAGGIYLRPGDTTSGFDGARVQMQGGVSAGGEAGEAELLGGYAYNAGGNGGRAAVQGGEAGTSGRGGSVGITAGNGRGSGPGGDVTISAGRTILSSTGLGSVRYWFGASERLRFDGERKIVIFRNDLDMVWSATSSPSGSPDAGVKRDSAGVVRVTDGGTGYGKLALGGATALGSSGAVLGNVPAGAGIAQLGWLELIVNGNTRYVPLWG